MMLVRIAAVELVALVLLWALGLVTGTEAGNRSGEALKTAGVPRDFGASLARCMEATNCSKTSEFMGSDPPWKGTAQVDERDRKVEREAVGVVSDVTYAMRITMVGLSTLVLLWLLWHAADAESDPDP